MLPLHPEDAVLYSPSSLVGAAVRFPGQVPDAFHSRLSISLTPSPQGSLGDPEDPADVLRFPRLDLEDLAFIDLLEILIMEQFYKIPLLDGILSLAFPTNWIQDFLVHRIDYHRGWKESVLPANDLLL